MLNAVAAFWSLDAPDWATLADSNQNSTLSVVVADGSIPAAVAADPNALQAARSEFSAIPGVVLGYVFSRTGGGDYDDLRLSADVVADVDAWYANLGDYIDGIYFDNAVIPGDALDQQTYVSPTGTQHAHEYWTALLEQVRTAHPDGRSQRPAGSPPVPHSQMMLLAGASPNKWLLSLADFLLMWETDPAAYYEHFAAYGQVQIPAPPAGKWSLVAYPPRWWKDPANSAKIVHTVNRTAAYEQRVTYLAFTERNAGQLWQTENYGALPSYWDTEVGEARFLSDHPSAALNDEQIMRAAHRVGVAHQALTAWPNFEAAWYEQGQVRGTIFVKTTLAGVSFHDVLVADLQQTAWGDLCGDPVALYDVAGLWAAAHTWAQGHGFETAIPTFEAGNSAAGPVFGVIAFDTGLQWLKADSMPVAAAYEQPPPGFSDAGAVVRNVHRWATSTGAAQWGRAVLTGWPSFQVPVQPEPVTQAPLPADPEGRVNGQFAVYMVDETEQGIYWQDIASEEYLNAL